MNFNQDTIGLIKQRLEILWQLVESLETGGGSPTDAYTKAQTDALLDEKADKSSTYTKTETNTLLNAKANTDNVYTKTETEAEIQGAITDLDVTSTAETCHYIDYISQENGLIVPHSQLSSTVPTTDSTTLITSGAVKAALGNYYTKVEVDSKDGAVVDNDGVKNLLVLNPPSTSSGGVSLTVNTDGTITSTGGTSSSAAALVLNNNVVLPAGDYILSGCPSGGSDNTYRLDISGTNYYDIGSGVQFTSTGAAITIRIRVGANTSVDNFVWKPMIRKASITNGDFVSYAPNNHELWEMIKALQPTLNNSLRSSNLEEEELIEERDDINGDNR